MSYTDIEIEFEPSDEESIDSVGKLKFHLKGTKYIIMLMFIADVNVLIKVGHVCTTGQTRNSLYMLTTPPNFLYLHFIIYMLISSATPFSFLQSTTNIFHRYIDTVLLLSLEIIKQYYILISHSVNGFFQHEVNIL